MGSDQGKTIVVQDGNGSLFSLIDREVERIVRKIYAIVDRFHKGKLDARVLKIPVNPEQVKHPPLDAAVGAALATGLVVAFPTEPYPMNGIASSDVAVGDWDLL